MVAREGRENGRKLGNGEPESTTHSKFPGELLMKLHSSCCVVALNKPHLSNLWRQVTFFCRSGSGQHHWCPPFSPLVPEIAGVIATSELVEGGGDWRKMTLHRAVAP